jgi:hypothetical protein
LNFKSFPGDRAGEQPAEENGSDQHWSAATTASSFLPWEFLVTDGHVLGARLRRIAPWLIGTGIFLILAAVLLPTTGQSSPWEWTFAFSSSHIEEQRAAYMQPVIERLEKTPTQEFTYQQRIDLAPVEEIPAAIEAILQSLKSGGGLYSPKLYLKEIPSSTFWSWEWTPQEQSADAPVEAPHPNSDGKIPNYIYVAKGSEETYALGAFARREIEYSNGGKDTKAVRWVAIVRKFPDGWKLVSLNWGDFYLATSGSSATLSEIPTSLRLALNLPEAK